MSVDLSGITQLTVQIDAIGKAAASTADPSAKALLTAQQQMLQAQLMAAATHAQAQADASSNLLGTLGLFATLQATIGSLAPTIITLFK